MELKNHHTSSWMFAEGSRIVSKHLPIRRWQFTKRNANTLSVEEAGPSDQICILSDGTNQGDKPPGRRP